MSDHLTGQQIGNVIIGQRIGDGTMGIVYKDITQP